MMAHLKQQLEEFGWEYRNRYNVVFSTSYRGKYLSILYDADGKAVSLHFYMEQVDSIFLHCSIHELTIEVLQRHFKKYAVDPFIIESPFYPLLYSSHYLN